MANPDGDGATGVVRLAFRDPDGNGDGGGSLTLDPAARTLRFDPPPRLAADLTRAAGRADETALKWGASLLFAFATAGTALWWRDRRGGAAAAYTLAGLTGVAGWYVRGAARGLPGALLGPLPLSAATLDRTPDGGLRLVLDAGGGPRRLTLTLGPGEFDPAAADALLRAVGAAK